MRMTVLKKRKTALLAQTSDQRPRLTDRQQELLELLSAVGWATPMDIGARDQSHHCATLGQLVKKGLVERKKLHAIYCYNGSTQRQKLVDNRWVYTDGHPPSTACCCKGSCRYQITRAGREVLKR
jgi:hypothetical protein